MKVMILAGGSGTRLWPLSRRVHPKQFLRSFQGESLLQKAIKRALAIVSARDIVIVANREYEFQIRNHVREIDPVIIDQLVLEPCARNTAPAIALGVSFMIDVLGAGSNEPILVMPSDHLIDPVNHFRTDVETAFRIAEENKLATFGIVPDKPETGYGYIQRTAEAVHGAYPVVRFVEKPDMNTAVEYVESGEYLWNSGMFAFTVRSILDAFSAYMPTLSQAVAQGFEGLIASFDQLSGESIDYGVMEKSGNVMVIPATFAWSDVGSWDSFYNVLKKDAASNVITGDVLPVDTQNCLILGGKRLIATVGIENLLVVETPDAILIAQKGDTQKVKTIVETLKAEGRREVEENVTVDRPWGSYTIVESKPGFKIKEIVVAPGEKLSLQLHHHRSEHWVVTSGTAKVRLGENRMVLKENEGIFVPKESLHRLENSGDVPLRMVEVQVGDYLGEDDIERFDDVYGREVNGQE